MKKRREISHLFSKIVVGWCVACGSVSCAWALRILSRTGQDPSAVLGVILRFFGGELLLLCLKKVLGETEKKKKSDENKEETV